jgi:tRNA1(Val) A37 N6-methylase TrmN6
MNLINVKEGQCFTQKKGHNSSLDLYSFTQMQIKLAILTICASLAAIGFATPAP